MELQILPFTTGRNPTFVGIDIRQVPVVFEEPRRERDESGFRWPARSGGYLREKWGIIKWGPIFGGESNLMQISMVLGWVVV